LIFVFLGPPGSGKGTQAERLADKFKIPHIALGDILRETIREGSEVGKVAKGYVEAGKLVPDEMTIKIVEERIKRPDCKNGFILDGFPRSLIQAEALKGALAGQDYKVVYIDVPLELTLIRNAGRLSCVNCGAVYNLKNNPPKKAGICDKCGGSLYERKDDNREVIATRFKVYKESTAPLVEYYKDRLVRIDGNGSIEEVFIRLLKALGV